MFDKDKTGSDIFWHWFKYRDIPLMIVNSNGDIFVVNAACEKFLGYNDWELTKSQKDGNGISWYDLSVKDENLEADKQMAQECEKGIRVSYTVKKQYIPKNDKPAWVESNVIRYPKDGEVQFLIMSLTPLKNGSLMAFNSAMEKIEEFNDQLVKLVLNFEKLPVSLIENIDKSDSDLERLFKTVARIIEKNPKISAMIALVLTIMLLGQQLVSAINIVKGLL